VVDIDEAELDKYRDRYDRTICADAGNFLSQLKSAFDKPFSAPAEWIAHCNIYRERYPMVGPENADQNGFINSYRFMEKLSLHMKPDQVVVTDAGSSFVCAGQVLKITPPQRLMASRGLGEMGFGLPGSIGASFARDRGEVMCLNCDGSMMMNLQELQTIVHHKLPIKIIIFSNDGYLSIKHTQNAWFEGRHTSVDRKSGVSCPDYSAVARAFGISAFQIRTWDDYDEVMPRMQALPGPAICEVFLDPEQPFAPKLAAVLQDGKLVSPPLEDLSPQLPRKEFAENMLIGVHPKSASLIP
jgi:acetolactate synthase-1/2/3 large subunit